MIKYENIEVDNLNTEGFEVTLPDKLSIKFAEGTFTRFTSSGKVVKTFPEIEFDVEPDDELLVIYDVYLLDVPDSEEDCMYVERTELGLLAIPIYSGEAPLLHCLMSIQVPPNTKKLSDLSLTVRTINHVVREEVPEVQTVPEKYIPSMTGIITEEVPTSENKSAEEIALSKGTSTKGSKKQTK